MKKIVSLILISMLFLSSLGNTIAAYSPSINEVNAANFLALQGVIIHPIIYKEEHGYSNIGDIKNIITVAILEGNVVLVEDLIKMLVDKYRLGDTITRQEVIKIIAKISEEEIIDTCRGDFDDVKTGWGCKYIEWALDKEYIAKNSTFRPEDKITKTEAMKLILKVKGIPKVTETDNWQKDYADTGLEYDIIEKAYTNYNADAYRGWIFLIATATIEKEEEIKVKIKKKSKLISDEASPE